VSESLFRVPVSVGDLAACDKAASVAHDFIWGKNGVTKQQASDAIWLIHNALRPHLPMDDETRAAVLNEVGRDDAAKGSRRE
jgi:hypothetical protein